MKEDLIGKGWSFPSKFNEADGVEMVSDEEEIEQSLRILFSTEPGERLFHPDFGCDLRRFQFAPNNRVTVLHIQKMVETTVRKYEPRITVNSVYIDAADIMDGRFVIHLDYTVNATMSSRNMIYPYYFD